jgi:nicotinamide-nucleotide amidase
MRCEIVAVGTELLLGQITDTNSAWIGEQLALCGIDSHFHTAVGDNVARIVETLRTALRRSDAVIVCGGLGPTQDDLTREALAETLGVPLVRDAEAAELIRARFRERGREMPDNNLRQADVPRGGSRIPQMPGTAPGLIYSTGSGKDAQVIYAVPGVPSEMRAMLLGTVLPDLQARADSTTVIKSRVLRTWGHSESGVAELLAERIRALDGAGNPTLAFQASGMEGLKVRITAKAEDEARATAIIADEERRVRAILGQLIFGVDGQTMESVVLDELEQRGLTLGAAESLTGGMVGMRLTDVPGASRVFRGSVVAYDSRVKHDVLGVPPGPVVSADAAQAMAAGARRVLGADVGIAATGVAGPAEQEGQPVGTVFLGLSMDDGSEAVRVVLPGNRKLVRRFATTSLFNLLRLRLQAGQV